MCGQYSDEWLAGGAHTFDGLPRVIGQTLIKCHTQGEEEGEDFQKERCNLVWTKCSSAFMHVACLLSQSLHRLGEKMRQKS